MTPSQRTETLSANRALVGQSQRMQTGPQKCLITVD